MSKLARALWQIEKDHITWTLGVTQGNVSVAASLLEIHRNTLKRKINTYGLQSRLSELRAAKHKTDKPE